MVDTIHPVDAVAGSPSYGGRMLRQVNAVAFGGATAARPLGGRSGVRPGTSVTTVTATSTTWTCGPLSGVADVETAAEAGLVTFALDAVATGAVTAASASFARQDLIYVQIDIPTEGDGSTVPVVARKYVAGTIASTDPPLPVSHAFAIARINVPISGGGSPTVTWLAPYAVAAGGTVPFPSIAVRDLWAGATDSVECSVPAYGGFIRFIYKGGTGWQVTGSSVQRVFLGLFADASYNNLQLIGGVVSLPPLPVPSRVLVSLTGLIGFSGTAAASFGTNAAATGGSIVADVQGNTGAYIHVAAQRVSHVHDFVVDVPANVASTVSYTMSTATTSAYFKGMLTARVLLPGEY